MTDLAEHLRNCVEEGLRGASAGWAEKLEVEVGRVLESSGEPGLCVALRESIGRASAAVDRVSVAVTGMGWLGGGVPAVERVLAEIVSSAQREILVTAYALTAGSERVWTEIGRAAATGIRCRVIVDRIDQQPAQTQALLLDAAAQPGKIEAYSFVGDDGAGGLHAKVFVVDREVALVGSANLSLRGMVRAHEMAVVVRGPTAGTIASSIDRLLLSPLVRRFP